MGAGDQTDTSFAEVRKLSKEQLVEWLKVNCPELDLARYVDEKGVDGPKISAMTADELMLAFDIHDQTAAARLFQRIKRANQIDEGDGSSSSSETSGKDQQTQTDGSSSTVQPPTSSKNDDEKCFCSVELAMLSDTGCCCCECESAPCPCVCAKGWYECCHFKCCHPICCPEVQCYRPLAAMFLYACLTSDYWTRTVAVALAPLVILAVPILLLLEGILWLFYGLYVGLMVPLWFCGAFSNGVNPLTDDNIDCMKFFLCCKCDC
jgi:hypothetical protein